MVVVEITADDLFQIAGLGRGRIAVDNVQLIEMFKGNCGYDARIRRVTTRKLNKRQGGFEGNTKILYEVMCKDDEDAVHFKLKWL